jgi:membrane fusion protein (multidrug efflux system)
MECMKTVKPPLYKSWVTIICCAVLATACSEPAAPTQAPREVKVIEIQPRDTPVTFEYVGRTASSQQVEVRSRVDGFLDNRLYTEGSIVKKGDVMFKMDAKPFQTQLAAARAALAEQQARLQVNAANLKRVKPLAAANAVSKKELDDAQGRVNSAAAAVEMAKADVDTAELNLGYTTIYAPVTGASSYARIQNGAYVNAMNSLLTYVAQLDPIWVDFNISENDMLKARSMKTKGVIKMPENGAFDVEIKLADDSLYPQSGHIFFSDANYSTETGTFLIRASFDNQEQQLRPGQFVRVLLKGAIQPNAILVPQKAVSQGAKGFFVWTIDKDNKAQIRNVQVGDWQEANWFILDGLSAGDRVVTDGFVHLSANAPVTIIADSAAGSPEPPAH